MALFDRRVRRSFSNPLDPLDEQRPGFVVRLCGGRLTAHQAIEAVVLCIPEVSHLTFVTDTEAGRDTAFRILFSCVPYSHSWNR